MRRNQYIELLEGQEFLSLTYESCVLVLNAQLWQNGKVIKDSLSLDDLKALFSDLCWHEGI